MWVTEELSPERQRKLESVRAGFARIADEALKLHEMYFPTSVGGIQMLNWYKFTEHNDNEGETWHFFIQLTKDGRDYLDELLTTGFDLNSYSISEKIFTEVEVDILVENSDSGYMDTYNKRPAPYSIEVMALPTDADELDELFYKGGFW